MLTPVSRRWMASSTGISAKPATVTPTATPMIPNCRPTTIPASWVPVASHSYRKISVPAPLARITEPTTLQTVSRAPARASTVSTGTVARHSGPSTTWTSSGAATETRAMAGTAAKASSSRVVSSARASRSGWSVSRENSGKVARLTVWPIIWTGITSTR